MEEDVEYRCCAYRKEIKNIIAKCTVCDKAFVHPRCTVKHRVYNKSREVVQCKGPFANTMIDNDKTQVTGGSTGGIGSVVELAPASKMDKSLDGKIERLVREIRKLKDIVTCKEDIKLLIKEVVRKELHVIRQEIDYLKARMRNEDDGNQNSYSVIVKRKKRMSLLLSLSSREVKKLRK